VEICDVSALQAQNKITGQSRQILFEGLPPQTQDLHGFFLPGNMKQKFAQLNDAEREWIKSSLGNARNLTMASQVGDAVENMTPERLDRAYKYWLYSGTDINAPANDVIHAIAFAFGQYLVDNEGFEWSLVTDQFGTDVGVRALPGRGDVLVCPASMVAKRWETKETDFLVPIYHAVIDQRNTIRDSWEAKGKSPWWKFW
jgi:hypothetical protein